MADFDYPLRLAPRYLEKPWGGRRLATVLGRELPEGVVVGESWEVFDRGGTSSEVLNGRLAGRRLHELRTGPPHPVLVKLLDATQTLSVQVHPGPEAALRLGGEPKTECWFVLHASPGARVYRGVRDGVTVEDVRAAVAAGEVEPLLHSFEVAAGDTVFVPAGTLHTIGAGVLLAEVQQNSDTTYRVHDWGRTGLDGRPRELHVEQALSALDLAPRGPDKIPAQEIEETGLFRRLLLVKCPHFAVEHVTVMGTFTLPVPPSPAGTPAVLHVLAGRGELRPFDRRIAPVEFGPGATLLLPGAHEEFEIAPGATIVRALVVHA